MRQVRYSKTFAIAFDALLAETERVFGPRVAQQKRALVTRCVESTLAYFPALKPLDGDIGLVVYPISKTAWSVLYDFDDLELRIHDIVYSSQNLDDADPGATDW
jgi:hypothetical protein